MHTYDSSSWISEQKQGVNSLTDVRIEYLELFSHRYILCFDWIVLFSLRNYYDFQNDGYNPDHLQLMYGYKSLVFRPQCYYSFEWWVRSDKVIAGALIRLLDISALIYSLDSLELARLDYTNTTCLSIVQGELICLGVRYDMSESARLSSDLLWSMLRLIFFQHLIWIGPLKQGLLAWSSSFGLQELGLPRLSLRI